MASVQDRVYAGETVRLECSLQDDHGKPLTPLPPLVTAEVWDHPAERLPWLKPQAMTLILEDRGTATAGSNKTITDTAQAWVPGILRGAAVRIVAGTGTGQERRIKDNTATVLTIDDKQVANNVPVGIYQTIPDATSVYEVHRARYATQWLTAPDSEDRDLVAVFRATKLPPAGGSYKGLDLQPFRLYANRK